MKTFILTLLLLNSFNSFADLEYSDKGPSQLKVKKLQKKIESKFMTKEYGVNGVGITACEENTGNLFLNYNENEWKNLKFVHCIDLATETEEAEQKMKKVFPSGKKFKGVYINIEFVGVIFAN